MTRNPLDDFVSTPRPGKVTVEMLEQLRDSLNRSAFVCDSGLPYFVGRKVEDDGSTKHFLDRKISTGRP
jgi:hypothetical protein